MLAALLLQLQVSTFTLPNGLRVVVNEDRSTANVGAELFCLAGTRDERRGRFGIAHLYEHMNGPLRVLATPDRREAYYEQLLDSNGQTRLDYVRYYALVPAGGLDFALAAFADRLDADPAAVAPERLDADRAIVLAELRRAQERGEHDPRLAAVMNEAVFGAGHPYGHEVYGSAADLAATTIDDMRAWAAAHRGAAHAVLVLAGNIGAGDARARVERAFGALAPGEPLQLDAAWAPADAGQRRVTVERNLAQGLLTESWRLPGWAAPEIDDVTIFADVLVQRLKARGVEASAAVESYQLAGRLTLSAPLAEATEATVAAELAGLLRAGPTAAELAATRTRRHDELLRGLEGYGFAGDRLRLLGEGLLFAGDASFYRVRLDRLAHSTTVAASARRLLSPPPFVLTVRPAPVAPAGPPPTHLLPPPPPPTPIPPPSIREQTLPGGLRLVVIEKHDLPIIDARLVIDTGGAALAGPALDVLGDGLETAADLDFAILAGDLDRLGERLAHPPLAALAKVRAARAARVAADRRDPMRARWRVLGQLLTGAPLEASGNYGYTLTGALADVPDAAALAAYLHATFRPERATLVVAGDTTLEAVAKRAATWPHTAPVPAPVAAPAPASVPGALILLDRPGATQAYLLAAQRLPDGADPLGRTAVEAALRARLNESLRERNHWSYVADATVAPSRRAPFLYLEAPVPNEHVAEAIRAVLAELDGLTGARPLTDAEVARVRRNLRRPFQIAGDTLDGLIDAQIARLRGPTPALDRIDALTGAELQAAARALLRPGELVWVVTGDRATVEPELRKLGPVTVVTDVP